MTAVISQGKLTGDWCPVANPNAFNKLLALRDCLFIAQMEPIVADGVHGRAMQRHCKDDAGTGDMPSCSVNVQSAKRRNSRGQGKVPRDVSQAARRNALP
jgi:hypothetical protein